MKFETKKINKIKNCTKGTPLKLQLHQQKQCDRLDRRSNFVIPLLKKKCAQLYGSNAIWLVSRITKSISKTQDQEFLTSLETCMSPSKTGARDSQNLKRSVMASCIFALKIQYCDVALGMGLLVLLSPHNLLQKACLQSLKGL